MEAISLMVIRYFQVLVLGMMIVVYGTRKSYFVAIHLTIINLIPSESDKFIVVLENRENLSCDRTA